MNKKLRPLEEAIYMYERAKSQKLMGFERLSNYELTRKVCNGIGAAWMPEWARTLVSNLAPSIVPTSWIHDLDYEDGGGIWKRWCDDWRFLCNGIRGSIYDYKWYRLRRYYSIWQAVRLWRALRLFGQPAYNWRMR